MHEEIRAQLAQSMKARDTIRTEVIRGLLTAFTNEAVSSGKTPHDILDDATALTIVKRLAKQRKDSIEQFTSAGRTDLADNEAKELTILQEFLPAMLDESAVRIIVEETVAELKVSDMSQMGVVIGAVMKKTSGQADGTVVKEMVQRVLSATKD
jgi:hypothetical protein